MGVEPAISYAKFPKQGIHDRQRVAVVFNHDTSRSVGGIIVRDDTEEPYVTIIELDDGRYVLGTECQYKLEVLV